MKNVFYVPITKTETEYVTRTVHEYKAPTDDSVRLLNEFEQLARDRIIARFLSPAGDNKIGAIALQENFDNHKLSIFFVLNGTRIDVTIDNPISYDLEDWVSDAINVVSDAIAKKVLYDAMLNFRKVKT